MRGWGSRSVGATGGSHRQSNDSGVEDLRAKSPDHLNGGSSGRLYGSRGTVDGGCWSLEGQLPSKLGRKQGTILATYPFKNSTGQCKREGGLRWCVSLWKRWQGWTMGNQWQRWRHYRLRARRGKNEASREWWQGWRRDVLGSARHGDRNGREGQGVGKIVGATSCQQS